MHVLYCFPTVLSFKNIKFSFNSEAVLQGCSVKKVFLEISQNSQESTCARVSFLMKMQDKACNFIKKETLPLVFSCEFCDICKNTFFTEHLRWLLLLIAALIFISQTLVSFSIFPIGSTI